MTETPYIWFCFFVYMFFLSPYWAAGRREMFNSTSINLLRTPGDFLVFFQKAL